MRVANKSNSIIFVSCPINAKVPGLRLPQDRLRTSHADQAIAVVEEIRAGKHKDKLAELPQGKLVIDPDLAEQITPAANELSRGQIEARLDMIKSLLQHGYQVAVIIPHPHLGVFPDADFVDGLREIGLDRSDLVEVATLTDSSLKWPRNAFIQLADNIFYEGELAPVWLTRFGFTTAQLVQCPMGNSAAHLLGDRFAFMTSPISAAKRLYDSFGTPAETLKQLTTTWAADLMRAGYRTVYLASTPIRDLFPQWFLDEHGIDFRLLAYSGDLDYVAFSSPADRLLALHGDTYKIWEGLRSVMGEEQPHFRVVGLAEGNHPHANSLPLPGGGVFMDAGAGDSRLTVEATGTKVITTAKAHQNYGQPGWINCASNVITPPA